MASLTQTANGRWLVRWYTPERKHPSRTFASKPEADRFMRRLGVDIDEGRDTTRKPVAFQVVIDQWWQITEGSVKPRTAERYLIHTRRIEKALGHLPVSEVSYQAVQDFTITLQQEWAPKTVHHAYGVLALILKHAHRLGLVDRPIPKPILPRVSKPRLTVPSRHDVEAAALASDARLHAAVVLAGYCGLRQGELLALRREDVNLAEGWVFVHQARNKTTGALESTKTESVRRVYLPAHVRSTLTDHLEEYESERLFPVTASIFDKSWRRARTTAELSGVRFHDLRHAACSMMIAAGATVMQVSRQLGHANPTQTLDTYGHLWPDSYEDLVRRMDTYLAH